MTFVKFIIIKACHTQNVSTPCYGVPMKIYTDVESEGLPLSALALVAICPCGATALYARPKDAPFMGVHPCSDACKSVAECRNAWYKVYDPEQADDSLITWY